MDANTGRHPIISTPSTLGQNRTDRVDTRALREGKTADRREFEVPEKISEGAPIVAARPDAAAHRADTRTGHVLESAVLAAVARTPVSDSIVAHSATPNLPEAFNAVPTPVVETTARGTETQGTDTTAREVSPASELDEIVLDAMLGMASPDAKLDTTTPEVQTPTQARSATGTPRVTIVMPAYNEEKFIETCIASVQAQDYPRDAIEILVADGRSSDKTREILARLSESDPRIRMIDNPARLQAAGLGLAVKEARGEIIVRMDVHAEYAPDYVRQCVATLEKTGAHNVGGAQRARAKSLFQKALCVALGSKLGTGGAGYRHKDSEGFVDTVFLGAFRRKVFETVGLWDPNAITNEDSELNQRILESGGTIYLSKDIVVHYYPRESLKALATQYFRYGRGRARTLLKMGRVPTIRPFLPFLAMTGLGATVALPPLWPLAPLAFGAYALATGAEAIRIGRGLGAKGVATVWSIFPTLHASHAAGVWAGLLRYLRNKDWTDEPEVVAPLSAQTEPTV